MNILTATQIKVVARLVTRRQLAAAYNTMQHPQLKTHIALIALYKIAQESPENAVQIALEHTADGKLIFAFIGLAGVGIIAQYNAPADEWRGVVSHGNFGKNAASGGTWKTLEITGDALPTSITAILSAELSM